MSIRRTTRLFTAVTAFATLGVTLAACGGSGSGTPAASSSTGGSSSASSGSGSPASQPISALLPKAKQEGSLTWYTTFATKDVPKMIAAFNKQYPDIKVNAVRLSADKIPARVETEQKGGQYTADVISGDSPQLAQLIQAGAMQPYDPPDAAPLPAGLSLPSGYQGVVYAVTTVIAYNPAAVKSAGLQPPTSWQDLTKPQWKGKFSIDPGAVNWYESLVVSMGQSQAQSLLKGLGANNPKLVTSHTLATTQVEAGEPLATATAYGYKVASEEKKDPGKIAFVNTNPLPASLTLVDIAKNAPHPAAAELFEDWLVSQQGQQAVVAETDHTSLRSDVTNNSKVWDPSTWPPAWGNPLPKPQTYNTDTQFMRSALGAA